MAENELTFFTVDIVFTKLKGYRHWPATISDILKPKEDKSPLFKVTFFGDKTTGTVNQACSLIIQINGIPTTNNLKNNKSNIALSEAECHYKAS